MTLSQAHRLARDHLRGKDLDDEYALAKEVTMPVRHNPQAKIVHSSQSEDTQVKPLPGVMKQIIVTTWCPTDRTNKHDASECRERNWLRSAEKPNLKRKRGSSDSGGRPKRQDLEQENRSPTHSLQVSDSSQLALAPASERQSLTQLEGTSLDPKHGRGRRFSPVRWRTTVQRSHGISLASANYRDSPRSPHPVGPISKY